MKAFLLFCVLVAAAAVFGMLSHTSSNMEAWAGYATLAAMSVVAALIVVSEGDLL